MIEFQLDFSVDKKRHEVEITKRWRLCRQFLAMSKMNSHHLKTTTLFTQVMRVNCLIGLGWSWLIFGAVWITHNICQTAHTVCVHSHEKQDLKIDFALWNKAPSPPTLPAHESPTGIPYNYNHSSHYQSQIARLSQKHHSLLLSRLN